MCRRHIGIPVAACQNEPVPLTICRFFPLECAIVFRFLPFLKLSLFFLTAKLFRYRGFQFEATFDYFSFAGSFCLRLFSSCSSLMVC